MQLSTSTILPICDDIFNPEISHQLARSTGFIQRSSSKINGHEFIKALILPSNGSSEDSLNSLCERMREFNPEVNISASALAQRINTKSAVQLMKACFEKLLKNVRVKLVKQYSSLEGALTMFNNIYLQDSTVFEINKKLVKFFPGTKRGGKKGGSSCKSQMKIDLIQNFATGQITDAEICKGKLPDQALTRKIESIIKKGDLVLRDLGYFKIESLRAIDSAEAFFLTRFPSHVKVYLNRDDEKPTDLATYLNKNYKHASTIDLKVWISAERLEVRLVAYKTPKEILEERRRKAYKSAKEMGRNLSKEKLALLGYSLFVTNIPAEKMAVDMIGTVYRLRWEIELIFKTWKSQLRIDVLEGLCRYRILCLIWGRLCMVILIAHITAGFQNLAKSLSGELSPTKLVSYLLRNGTLSKAIQTQTILELENKMAKDIKRRLFKEKRSRTTMRERVINSESYYEHVKYA